MEIKILGTGCASCKALHKTVKQAVAELGIEATVIKEEDLMQIMNYNVMSMPGLVIDEKVVSAGKKLSVADVKAFLTK
ncbi:MAG: thioredoxin family protein [Bacteroidales bacterium]